MAIYLETNALRKLTDYSCKEPVYTSIFSVFEILSGITETDFYIRKACLERINEQKLEIKGPMVDKLLMILLGESGYNEFAYEMIMDLYNATLKAASFSELKNVYLCCTDENGKLEFLTIDWLNEWDEHISNIRNDVPKLFEEESKDYIKDIYNSSNVKGLAEYFWKKIYENRLNEDRIAHAEGFVGQDAIKHIRQETEELFSKYNYKLFMTAQAVVFSISYFINGNRQNRNNPSDLLHLLYLNENDKFVSNDKIYQTIFNACPEFNLIELNNEKRIIRINMTSNAEKPSSES